MQRILDPNIGVHVSLYIDDVLIIATDIELHFKSLSSVATFRKGELSLQIHEIGTHYNYYLLL